MAHPRLASLLGAFLLAIAGIALLGGSTFFAQASKQAQIDPVTKEGTVIARVYFTSIDDKNQLASRLDVWEVNPAQGYLLAALSPDQFQALSQAGYLLEIDAQRTAGLSKLNAFSPGQLSGIPGFSCYRTVEETNQTLSNLAIQYPGLAKLVKYGESWKKATTNDAAGYDLFVLVLTNHAIPGPKPKFFLMAEIHAREYATAETATRYAEYLLQNYGKDPDVTWLLDANEIHIAPMTNPDGRKLAEEGYLQRKNVNNTNGGICSNPPAASDQFGTDLNRNSAFHWNGSGGGASNLPCDQAYQGPSAASEPETQALQNYMTSIFPAQRGTDDFASAPITTTGLMITLHAYSQLVLWPYGWTSAPSPNAAQLQTLGRRLAYFNNYTPEQSNALYITTGTTDDWAYGKLGISAFTIEMGTDFFQDCDSFNKTIFPDNLKALLFAAKAARLPYLDPSGPEITGVTLSPAGVPFGSSLHLSATVDDTPFNNSNGNEPTQNITAAAYFIDNPPWSTSPAPITYTLTSLGGQFNRQPTQLVEGTIDPAGLKAGRHTVFVKGQDASNRWGVPTAAFFCAPYTAISVTQVTTGTISAGQLATFQAEFLPLSASQPFTYTVGFSDSIPTVYTTTQGSRAHISHIFSKPGDYTLTVYIENCTDTAAEGHLAVNVKNYDAFLPSLFRETVVY